MMAGQGQFTPGFSLAGAVDLESLKHRVEAEPGQDGGAPAAGGYVVDTTEGTFQAMVQTSATFPILVLLWIPTDARVVAMARTLGEEVNALQGQIQLSRIDVGTYPSIAQALQVQGAPALFGLIGGRPMPILQGLPSDDELRQVCDRVIPQVIQLAQQSGVTGSAPYAEVDGQSQDEDGSADERPTTGEQVPPEHAEAHRLAQAGEYADAAAAYAAVLEADPGDALARRERAKALLLARSGDADVREVRGRAAESPDDLEAQLAGADVDMIGGQIADAFARLLDFAASHRADLDAVRERLLEYFAIPQPDDGRVRSARRRLSALMY